MNESERPRGGENTGDNGSRQSAPSVRSPNAELRRRFLYVALGSLLLLLMPFDIVSENEFWKRLADVFHVPLFAVIAAVLHMLTVRAKGFERALILSHLSAAAFALAVEIIQPYTGRSGSVIDLLNGISGVALSAAVLCALHERSLHLVGRGIWGIVALAVVTDLLVGSAPAYRAYLLLSARERMLPLVAGFDQRFEQQLWSPTEKSKNTRLALGESPFEQSGLALRVETIPEKFSGAAYDAQSLDISGYSSLSFSLYLEGTEPVSINVRVDDDADCTEFDSRFNRQLSLAPGRNELSIPIDEIKHGPKYRELDLRAISRIIFFVSPLPKPVHFMLDNVRLR